ncbi:MAG: type II toxin-antitoxin system PemK/MazF family toxin [Candidatus Woesearchaeota archaeon]
MFEQRSIVLLPFPFSDQSNKKIRPAIVISKNSFNDSGEDILVCAMTSQISEKPHSLLIDKNDVEIGVLSRKSLIKVDAILRIKKDLIIKKIDMLNQKKFAQVLRKLNSLFI